MALSEELAAACRGESKESAPAFVVNLDRVNTLPRTPNPGEAPLSDRQDAPAAWQAMLVFFLGPATRLFP